MKKFLPILASSFLSAILAIFIYKCLEGPQKVIIKDNTAAAQYAKSMEDPHSGALQRQFLSSSPTDFISAAEMVTPAVVNIKAVEDSNFEWWGGGSFGASSGSGVIISPDGYIITNNHVIEDGNRYDVTLNNNQEYQAKLVGTDPTTDLALLKIISDKTLPYLILGNSDSLRVGEWVLAVGNPFNLSSTVTAGIVSAKGRNIDILEGEYSIESFIQTDAAVNPGNSGGALVNTNGELVGINTAIITRSGRYEGYSFAVPSNLAQKVIRDIRDYGEVQRGLLGVRINPVDSEKAKELGLPSIEGVYISNVTANGGAFDAGIRSGDVVIGINGLKISNIPTLQEQVGRYRPGNTIAVEYIRNSKKYTTNVTLRDKDNGLTLTKVAGKVGAKELLSRIGMELRDLSKDELRRLRVNGVYVESVDIGSLIEKTEMDPGYIITKVNDSQVSNIEDFVDELNGSDGKKILLEGFYENYPGEYYYTFAMK
ncbi:MAG: serine protease Do [Paraglaciecola sp.]|jgi:serine protease Do